VSQAPRTVTVRAYAKLNLALEVLGKRVDGYHELRTVLQTISLADTITLTAPVAVDSLQVCGQGKETLPAPADNIAGKALRAYRAASDGFANDFGVSIALHKRTPAAAGLGGGSSDGAAVLRALDAINPRPLGREALETIAAGFGSDTPFFVRGGTQLAEGRGEQLVRLPDGEQRWYVLLPLPGEAGQKTGRLFSLLRQINFSGGTRTEAVVAAFRNGMPLAIDMLTNTFEHVETTAFPDNPARRAALVAACGHAVLSGAGPSLFALAPDEATAHSWAARLRPRLPVRVVHSVTSEAASVIDLH
jgi:4-diphosphocytidyl-2-C-methyl-D-erythritol kinase